MNHHTPESLIAFEDGIRAEWEAGLLPFLLHLCGGNEKELCALFTEIERADWVFSTHRNHYHALLKGIPPDRLRTLIREGKSMFVFDAAERFFSSSILSGTASIAAGVAFDIAARGGSEKVWCFVGDGAEEEGHFYEAVMFVEAHKLPCTFIIEDNDRQVDTPKAERRGEFPGIQWPACVRRYSYRPTYPHAGSGCAHKIEFSPLAVEAYLKRLSSA